MLVYKIFKEGIYLVLLLSSLYSQNISLEYIFQDTNIINPRPGLKAISQSHPVIYYYADDDFNGTLSLFEYNYSSNSYYKFPDTSDVPAEFIMMEDDKMLSVIGGDLFVTKNFSYSREFTKDLQLTKSDAYEFSPMIKDNIILFRRSGNYFLTQLDTIPKPELQLTSDESDSVSYQILAISDKFQNNCDSLMRILFARYNDSPKKEILFPDFTGEYVTVERQKRGIPNVRLLEIVVKKISPASDSLGFTTTEIFYPDSVRYSTQYAVYSPDLNQLILDSETLDRHIRKIFSFNLNQKIIKEIYTESDTAWFERHGNETRFISDDEIIFESEVSGYSSLYGIKTDGKELHLIAGDSYSIIEYETDLINRQIYYIANKDEPASYGIYRCNFSGEETEIFSYTEGVYENLKLTKDGKILFFDYSNVSKPPEIFMLSIQDSSIQQITRTISPKFSEIKWTIPQLINFINEEDGQIIYAYLYKPENFSSKKKYPLICFAHGAGYLQNVTKGFSPYQDNFMVNTFLVSQGFCVLDVDFRGSFGYGKNFRNKTYRNLGYWEVSDFISGINYLDKQKIIDRNKVGIYGGSYGGFITLMATMRHPEYFRCGVALRAVSDWGNYFYGNWWYTLARLGDFNNESNKEYYKISSPITYAENLSVPLLITHGMKDDNVFLQQSAQLVQKLIDLKKEFEVMYYPKEYHSFRLQTSWLDQYKRIFNFFEKHLK